MRGIFIHLGHLCLPDCNFLLAPISIPVSTTSILIFEQGWGPSSESWPHVQSAKVAPVQLLKGDMQLHHCQG